MEKLVQWVKRLSLVQRILIGLAAGVLLGLLAPGWTFLSILGSLFVGALKAIAPILVFLLVTAALAQHKQGQRSNLSGVVLLYLLGTFLAGLCAVAASFLFPVTVQLQADVGEVQAIGGIGEVIRTLLMNLVDNPVQALASGNYIGLLFWAVLCGVALKKASPGLQILAGELAGLSSRIVGWVIQFAPLGILGLIFDTVSRKGFQTFVEYGQLILLLVGTMLFMALVVNPLIAFVAMRKNPYPLVLRCLKGSGLTAFATRSSAANIPVNLRLCEELGLDRDTYSISIPLGATINMGGAAITISVLAMAAAHTLQIPVDFLTALILSLLAAASACGASGVAGGSLLLVPLACSLFGIPNEIAMQVVGTGFVIGVIQDSCETALNSSTDVLYTALAEYSQSRRQRNNTART